MLQSAEESETQLMKEQEFEARLRRTFDSETTPIREPAHTRAKTEIKITK